MSDTLKVMESFIDQWQDGSEQSRSGFLYLKGVLESLDGVILEFIAREGVTYSLRAKHSNQKDKALFVMVDVIEGEPRWLSVCFYAKMISDPEEKGDFVPQGLLGEDAVCFDIDDYSEANIKYVEKRIREGCSSAAA